MVDNRCRLELTRERRALQETQQNLKPNFPATTKYGIRVNERVGVTNKRRETGQGSVHAIRPIRRRALRVAWLPGEASPPVASALRKSCEYPLCGRYIMLSYGVGGLDDQELRVWFLAQFRRGGRRVARSRYGNWGVKRPLCMQQGTNGVSFFSSEAW